MTLAYRAKIATRRFRAMRRIRKQSRGRFFKELQKMNPFIGIHLKDTDVAWFLKCVWLVVLFSCWLKGVTSTMIGVMCRFCFTIFSKTQMAETTVLTQRFFGIRAIGCWMTVGDTHTQQNYTVFCWNCCSVFFCCSHPYCQLLFAIFFMGVSLFEVHHLLNPHICC